LYTSPNSEYERELQQICKVEESRIKKDALKENGQQSEKQMQEEKLDNDENEPIDPDPHRDPVQLDLRNGDSNNQI